jgi:hypothetical protein
MQVGVWVITSCGEEPRLNSPFVSNALDSSCTLREPHIAKPPSEQPTLATLLRQLTERTEATIDRGGVDAYAIVAARDLKAPRKKCRHPQGMHLRAPCRQEGSGRSPEAKLNPAARKAVGCDGSVCVRHKFGHDLHQIDAAQGKVLAKVASANRTDVYRVPRQLLSHVEAAYLPARQANLSQMTH